MFFATGGKMFSATGGKMFSATGGKVFSATGGKMFSATGGKMFSADGGNNNMFTGGTQLTAAGMKSHTMLEQREFVQRLCDHRYFALMVMNFQNELNFVQH